MTSQPSLNGSTGNDNTAPEPAPARPKNYQEMKERLYLQITQDGVEAFNAYRQQTGYSVLDLSGLDFTGKDLSGINLSSTNLVGCIFDFAYLADSTFVMANMQRCSARETDFYQSAFEEAELAYADLYKANFASTSMIEAVLTGVSAQEASFIDADLTDAKLDKADLSDANFTGAVLNGVNFKGATAKWANFDDVEIRDRAQLPRTVPDDEEM